MACRLIGDMILPELMLTNTSDSIWSHNTWVSWHQVLEMRNDIKSALNNSNGNHLGTSMAYLGSKELKESVAQDVSVSRKSDCFTTELKRCVSQDVSFSRKPCRHNQDFVFFQRQLSVAKWAIRGEGFLIPTGRQSRTFYVWSNKISTSLLRAEMKWSVFCPLLLNTITPMVPLTNIV